MSFVKQNINGILGTVLFHLIIIVVCMATRLSIPRQQEETFIVIDPQDFLDESIQEQTESEEPHMSDADIDKFLQSLTNVASNNSTNNTKYRNESPMSEADMKAKYEEEFLREKYGNDYDKNVNKTYEDYIDQNRLNNDNKSSASQSNPNHTATGKALVFVELENKDRGKAYIHVPVFTCYGGGTVVVDITINSSGKVVSAEIISSSVNSDGECLKTEAKNAALKSKFTKISGTKTEKGKITYQFINQ